MAPFGSKEEGPYTEINANGWIASHLETSNSDVHALHELNELNQGIYVQHEVALNDRIVWGHGRGRERSKRMSAEMLV